MKDLSSIFQGDNKRYVFYQSLTSDPSPKYRELAQYAATNIETFKTNFSMTQEGHVGNGIAEALAFLERSAAFERQKELQFFQNIQTAYPELKETFNIKVEDVLKDYPSFIANINRALKGTRVFQQELQSEIDRIKSNREAVAEFEQKNLAAKGMRNKKAYVEDLKRDMRRKQGMNNGRFFLKANGESAFRALFQDKGRMTILSNLIVEEYGASLFDKNLKLDSRSQSTLIAALTMKANEMLVSAIRFPTSKENIMENSMSVIESLEFKNFANTLLKSPTLSNTLESMASQYNISTKQKKKINKINEKIERYKQVLRSTYDKLSKEEKKDMSFDKWMQEMGLSYTKIKEMIIAAESAKAQCYYVGEDLSMLEFVANHIAAVLGGGRNPTDDIQAGKLIVDIEVDESKLDDLEAQLWAIQEEHFDKVGATSTYQSYIDNINQLIDARKEQEQVLKEFMDANASGEKALNHLLSHVTIHSTVKGYESAGSTSFEEHGGFGGAAFGSTLDSELSIINDMVTKGGLTPLDVNTLQQAMVNCGRLMIGASLKPVLENYFSAFMGMFMFNDASIFAQDVKNWIDGTIITSGVQDLHLYQLNGVVVPSSYILQETYNAMSKLQAMDSTYKGVKAVFSTYDKKQIPGDWAGTYAEAEKATKLERMHFLAGFLDLLESIQNALPG